jgi:hypothetical protein
MHDCRTTESRLVDLVFDELEASESLRLLAEVEACSSCLSEYRSMTDALLVFDRSIEESLPGETYWAEHQARRRESLAEIAPRAAVPGPGRYPLWKRIFAASLPVPVPIAAALVLALLISSVLALRPARKEIITQQQPPVVQHAPPQIIEVPVVQEKVVTRIVYVEKKEREKNGVERKAAPAGRTETTLTARQSDKESVQGGFFTHANLTDFQPADEMRIRVIKRSNPDEN